MKFTKKRIILLIIVLAFASLAAGCGGGGEGGAGGEGGENAQLKNVKFLSGPTGTTWYSQASAFAGIASKDLGMTVDVLTGSAISNAIQIENGKADVGLTFSSYLPAMAKGDVVAKIGEDEYFSAPVTNVNTLFNSTTAAYVFLVSADSPYKSVTDLKGANIRYVTYPVGFTARYASEKILEAHGITYDDIEAAGGQVDVVGKYKEACDLLAKGQADVIAYTMAVNAQSAALAELESQNEFRILTLDSEAAAKVTNDIPLVLETIPAGLHTSIKEDVEVLADITTWIVRADLDDETVTEILESVLANMETMAQVGNSEFKGFTAENLSRLYGKGEQIPFHPAAVKFFKEKGAIK